MVSDPQRAWERVMKVEEVILRALSKRITFWQAAWILQISPRHLRRIMERYRRCGFDGLLDRRRDRPSAKRVPWTVAEQVLCLYREKYFDFSVRHFHEKLREEHGILYSYPCIKRLPQGAGLGVRARQRGPHRRKRERRLVNQDNAMRIANRTLQIERTKWRGTLAKCRVLVCEQLDGTWSVFYGPHPVGRAMPRTAHAMGAPNRLFRHTGGRTCRY